MSYLYWNEQETVHPMCKRILYVEDNPRNMLLVRRILEAEGHKLLEAVDGESGWETAVSHSPDLILMDLRLPGELTGFELTRRLKAHPDLAHIPIVALTAYGSDMAEEKHAPLAVMTSSPNRPTSVKSAPPCTNSFNRS
ncbi:MAG: response regulator [Chloroflexi bacterium]|nr:response regulator [Chloroflexota bacterium]